MTREYVDIELFPASVGDSFLIRCRSNDGPVNILVDGGVRATYEQYLAQRLEQVRSAGEKLDLLVVTHIDTDHIGGALELLKANGPARKPNVIEICDIWHNGYRHLKLDGRAPSAAEKRRVLSQVSNPEATTTGEISVREAESLAALIKKHGYCWNNAFNGEAAIAGNKAALGRDICLTVLSPVQDNLANLAYLWRRGLLAMGVSHEAVDCPEFEGAFEAELSRLDSETAAQEADISGSLIYDPPDPSTFVEDSSATNGSSIAVLLNCFGLNMLFLGDAWPSVVSGQLDLHAGHCDLNEIDLVKVSHHGSRHNTSPQLLERIRARKFIVSTDGSKHGHPNVEAMLWIVNASKPSTSLVFNYPSQTADHMNCQQLRDRFGHEVIIGGGVQPVVFALVKEGNSGKACP